MKRDIVHSCYGCKYYYRVIDGKKEYLQPFSTRHCDIKNTWDCDHFANGGEPKEIKQDN